MSSIPSGHAALTYAERANPVQLLPALDFEDLADAFAFKSIVRNVLVVDSTTPTTTPTFLLRTSREPSAKISLMVRPFHFTDEGTWRHRIQLQLPGAGFTKDICPV